MIKTNPMRLLSLSVVLSFLFFAEEATAANAFTLKSPTNRLTADVLIEKAITYSVKCDGDVLLEKSPLSMTLEDGEAFGINPKLLKSGIRSVNRTIEAHNYKKLKVADQYNELTLSFKGDYQVIFRAYDDGIAYRFVSLSKKSLTIKDEQVVFNFPSGKEVKGYVPYVRDMKNSLEDQMFNSFENRYAYMSLSSWDKRRLAFTPLVVEGSKEKKVCIAESDLLNYPGMFLYNGDGSNSLTGMFAHYPKDIRQGGYNQLEGVVGAKEAFIAKYDQGISFPWRVVIVSQNDSELTNSDMIYKLATPNQLTDCSWIKAGKVAWDWWNDWNLYGVDFKAGINTETYKYYIDFASKSRIEYVVLDEGWAVNLKADLMQVVPEIDLNELVNYAKKKHVGLILWAGYYAFMRDMENVCRKYSAMGIKGFKVDFMNRDDQLMVDFQRRAAEMAARYHLVLDLHGTFKPAGLNRTYPNVLNFEGVHGLEQMKWVETDQVTYDVTIPYTRMVAGPMDYTPGAMRNASKGNYRPVYSEPMSQGTRCHQLAEYVVFESPLGMLCDSPSSYEKEAECTRFIAGIPTVWDKTLSLSGEIARYVTIARQKGYEWYVGALNGWDPRELTIDLSFLGEGDYKMEVFKDGINADKAACDYVHETISVPSDRKIRMRMASGGGLVWRIFK